MEKILVAIRPSVAVQEMSIHVLLYTVHWYTGINTPLKKLKDVYCQYAELRTHSVFFSISNYEIKDDDTLISLNLLNKCDILVTVQKTSERLWNSFCIDY